MTPFRNKPVKWDEESEGGRYKNKAGFKYDIITKAVVEEPEPMPTCFLAETMEEAEAIYKRFEKKLNSFAHSYSAATGVERAELFREGLIGLARAHRDWNPDRSESFDTYANFIIKDALNECVRKNAAVTSIPAYVKKANSNLNEIKRIAERNEVNWQVVVIDQELPISLPQNDAVRSTELVLNLIKAAKRSKVEYEKFIKRIELLPTNIQYEEYEEAHNEENDRLEAAIVVAKLKEHMSKTEEIICDGIMADKTYEQIGKELGKTGSWVAGQIKHLRIRMISMMKAGNI